MAKPLSHRRGASRPPSPDPIASSSKPTSLTLSTFEEGFDIAELINGLTESALQQSQQEGGGQSYSILCLCIAKSEFGRVRRGTIYQHL